VKCHGHGDKPPHDAKAGLIARGPASRHLPVKRPHPGEAHRRSQAGEGNTSFPDWEREEVCGGHYPHHAGGDSEHHGQAARSGPAKPGHQRGAHRGGCAG
jgi:hypothetical protein